MQLLLRDLQHSHKAEGTPGSLEEAFNIDQKVELVEEKLRKYFTYWLDLCNRKIK